MFTWWWRLNLEGGGRCQFFSGGLINLQDGGDVVGGGGLASKM